MASAEEGRLVGWLVGCGCEGKSEDKGESEMRWKS